MRKDRTAAKPGLGGDFTGRQRAHGGRRAQASSAPNPVARRAGDAPLQEALLAWYDAAKRDLPWRRTRDPYAIWVSEIMLQQTRVDTVIPYFQRFLTEYPTVSALAEAPLERVLASWSGLGYYRRARMLHAGAQQVVREHGGALPAGAAHLRGIAGIGAYTAGAVASIAWDERAPVVDGNVARVLARLFVLEDDVKSSAGQKRLWSLATELVPPTRAGDWNQALMELGATVCSPRSPRCASCPLRQSCGAFEAGRQEALPRASPKAKPRAWGRVALVLADAERVLLARRKAHLVFGGLWEPPGLDVPELPGEDADGARAESAARLVAQSMALIGQPRAAPSATPAGTVTHVLSHRRMSVCVLRGELPPRARHPAALPAHEEYDAVELVGRENVASRGVSTLARKILAAGGFLPG